jgi:SAM-dependent methyltransferase
MKLKLRRKLASGYTSIWLVRRFLNIVFHVIYWFRKLKVPKTMDATDERPGFNTGKSYREEHINFTLGRLDWNSQYRLFRLMTLVSETLDDPGQARILSLGPRNEIELYMLMLNGFKWSYIEAVDLVASTAKITPADFSEYLPFDDDSFDVVFTSHALSKSCDQQASRDEICRVLRPGGLFAIADNTSDSTSDDYQLKHPDIKVDWKYIVTGFPNRWHTVVDMYAESDYGQVLYARTLSGESFECVVRVN